VAAQSTGVACQHWSLVLSQHSGQWDSSSMGCHRCCCYQRTESACRNQEFEPNRITEIANSGHYELRTERD
jgi:hypothetical protein